MQYDPKKHHYIPRFILKNFCFNENQLFYYPKKQGKILPQIVDDVFRKKNLYRSIVLNQDDPYRLEKDFGPYEGEIATLVREKILGKDIIVLNRKEKESLTLFLAILSCRGLTSFNDIRSVQEGEGRNDWIQQYQPDKDFGEFLKRNLSLACGYRGIHSLHNDKGVDPPMKEYLRQLAFSSQGTYFVFLEPSGPTKFILGDCLPVDIVSSLPDGRVVRLVHFFPLSPSLLMALVPYGAMKAPCMESRKEMFKEPEIREDGLIVHHKVPISEEEALKINRSIFKFSDKGVVSIDEASIEASYRKKG